MTVTPVLFENAENNLRYEPAQSHPGNKTMSYGTMLYALVIIIVGLTASSGEASAHHCNRGNTACRGHPMAQAKKFPVKQYIGRPVAGISPQDKGCYGFDHGPVYSPKPCNFPYPCEYYGTCGGGRPWAHTISP